jgi:DNA-binding transcriptional ArsR family regulator
VGKALANPARLELLDLLAQGERSVEDLAETAQMKVSNTSAQLRMLAGAGLVASRRYGVRAPPPPRRAAMPCPCGPD